MNYQEALDNIGWIVVDSGADGYREPRTARDFFFGDFVKLQQLIDIYPEYLELKSRATPMKVLNREQHSKDSDAYGDCPICKTPLCDYSNPKGCGGCLQAIDWSEE